MATTSVSKTSGSKTSGSKTSGSKTAAAGNVIILKVALRGVRPPVWRRLAMPGTMTLAELHLAIQAAMGWEECHLHAFTIGDRHYGDRSSVDDVADENRVTLNAVKQSSELRFTYIYDFGDNWEHSVTIEKSEAAIEGKFYPACIAGKRNCPPEDCGGAWGYSNLLAMLDDPDHPQHGDHLDWLGDDFDPNDFSIEYGNVSLVSRFTITSSRP